MKRTIKIALLIAITSMLVLCTVCLALADELTSVVKVPCDNSEYSPILTGKVYHFTPGRSCVTLFFTPDETDEYTLNLNFAGSDIGKGFEVYYDGWQVAIYLDEHNHRGTMHNEKLILAKDHTYYIHIFAQLGFLKDPFTFSICGNNEHAVPQSDWKLDTAATCTTDGLEIKDCTECGEVLQRRIIKSPGHNTSGEVKLIREATCQQTGLTRQRCTVCNKIIEEIEIPKLSHVPSETQSVVPVVTCTTDGREVTKCAICGDIIDSRLVIAEGHNLSSYVVDEATHTQYRTCTVCNQQFERLALPSTETSCSWVCYNCSNK